MLQTFHKICVDEQVNESKILYTCYVWGMKCDGFMQFNQALPQSAYVLSGSLCICSMRKTYTFLRSQQHQTSVLGLMQTVEEGPSRGDMLLVKNAVLELNVLYACSRNFHKWMQNHSSIDAAAANADPWDREGGLPTPTHPPTPMLCKLPNF